MLQKLPSSQINLHCLSAEISKHQRYRSIYICVDPLYCFLDHNNRSRATLTASRVPGQSSAHTYTTTHRNKTVNVYKIKHIYILYWYFKQSQCLNLRKTCATTALNTHLSYIPPMLMLKIYRPRWTQCDDNTLDPLGLVMVR